MMQDKVKSAIESANQKDLIDMFKSVFGKSKHYRNRDLTVKRTTLDLQQWLENKYYLPIKLRKDNYALRLEVGILIDSINATHRYSITQACASCLIRKKKDLEIWLQYNGDYIPEYLRLIEKHKL